MTGPGILGILKVFVAFFVGTCKHVIFSPVTTGTSTEYVFVYIIFIKTFHPIIIPKGR